VERHINGFENEPHPLQAPGQSASNSEKIRLLLLSPTKGLFFTAKDPFPKKSRLKQEVFSFFAFGLFVRSFGDCAGRTKIPIFFFLNIIRFHIAFLFILHL